MLKQSVDLNFQDYFISPFFDVKSLSLLTPTDLSSLNYFILSNYFCSKYGMNSIIVGLDVEISIKNNIVTANVSPGSCMIDGAFFCLKIPVTVSKQLESQDTIIVVSIFNSYKKSIFEYSKNYIRIHELDDQGKLVPEDDTDVNKGFLPLNVSRCVNSTIFPYDESSITIGGKVIDISYIKDKGGDLIADLNFLGNVSISGNTITVDPIHQFEFIIDSNFINDRTKTLDLTPNPLYLPRSVAYIIYSDNARSPVMAYGLDYTITGNVLSLNPDIPVSEGDIFRIIYVRN